MPCSPTSSPFCIATSLDAPQDHAQHQARTPIEERRIGDAVLVFTAPHYTLLIMGPAEAGPRALLLMTRLKVAAFSLTPSSLKSLFPPPPFIPPLRWAPATLFHAPRHCTFGTFSHSTGHSRRRASSKAFVARSPAHRRVTCDVAVDLLRLCSF
jgi:hypothetical protein